jgi:hypothetical protein
MPRDLIPPPIPSFPPPQGSLPLPQDVPRLAKDFGVGAVVNMTREYAGPLAAYTQHGIRHLHLPTVDTAAPTLEQVGGRAEGGRGGSRGNLGCES